MKKFYLSALLLAAVAGHSQITATPYRGAFAPAPAAMWTDSWANFDPQNAVYPTPNVDVTANITTDTHWTAGNTYYLRNQIYVKNNATLTIDAGVIIRADRTATGAGLFVTKGSKLIAIGTAEKPIVFTSDNAPGSRNKGDWGGVILMGKGSSPITEVGAFVFSRNSLSLCRKAFSLGKCSEGETNGKFILLEDTLKKPVRCSTICCAFILPHLATVFTGRSFTSEINPCSIKSSFAASI